VAEQFGLHVNVDLTPDRHATLRLQADDIVYISPKRARMFAEDYVI
jgi:sulfate transport system ATP-binding protein